MADELDLINLALADLGEETELVALDQQPAPKGLRVAKRLLPALRDEFLRRHPWLCAERLTVLTPAAGLTPAHTFKSAYLLPEDALRVWSFDTREPWRRGVVQPLLGDGSYGPEQAAVLTDATEAVNATLTTRIDYALMDPCLFRAVAAELASRMAGPMQADKALKKALADSAREALAYAVTCETSEVGNEAPVDESLWLAGR